MANSMSRIEGFDEVINLLQTLKDRAPQMYRDELEGTAALIESEARRRVNDNTGKLKQSFRRKSKKHRGEQVVEISAGGSFAPHAHLVEFGHRMVTKSGNVIGDVPAHPFLRPAFEANKEALISRLTSILDSLIRG